MQYGPVSDRRRRKSLDHQVPSKFLPFRQLRRIKSRSSTSPRPSTPPTLRYRQRPQERLRDTFRARKERSVAHSVWALQQARPSPHPSADLPPIACDERSSRISPSFPNCRLFRNIPPSLNPPSPLPSRKLSSRHRSTSRGRCRRSECRVTPQIQLPRRRWN